MLPRRLRLYVLFALGLTCLAWSRALIRASTWLNERAASINKRINSQ